MEFAFVFRLDSIVSSPRVSKSGPVPPQAEACQHTGLTWTPIRRNEAGDIECMSLNAKDCFWLDDEAQCLATVQKYQSAALQPLVCGEMHQRVHGLTGYDDPHHWCYTGQAMFPKGVSVRDTSDFFMQYGDLPSLPMLAPACVTNCPLPADRCLIPFDCRARIECVCVCAHL